jgi:hypothetical protein
VERVRHLVGLEHRQLRHAGCEVTPPQLALLPVEIPIAASKLRPNFPPQLVGDGLRALCRGVEGVMVEPFRLFWSNLVLAHGFHGKEGVNGSSPLEGFFWLNHAGLRASRMD